LIAPADLGDDLEVGFETEQGGQRTADHGLVLGQQDADHATGTATRSRNPPSGRGPASTEPPNRSTRSRRPRRPLPSSEWAVEPSPSPSRPPSSTMSTDASRSPADTRT